MALIEFSGVTKLYNERVRALDNVSFSIDAGEFVFVTGASGAGKTTIIRLIMREEISTSGTVLMNGKDVAKMKWRDVPYLRRSMGIVFQDFKLIPSLTVYDNVAFALRVTGAPKRRVRSRVPYVLDLVDLARKANVYPEELSGGEQQRVALARALVNNPQMIIADEPTGNLDPELSKEMLRLLEKINEKGTTVVVLTHEKELVNYMKKRVIAIKRGVIISDGTGGYMI